MWWVGCQGYGGGMSAAEFRKKPVVVEAISFDGTLAKATEIIDWVLAGGGTARAHDVYRVGTFADGAPIIVCGGIHIDTLEGVMNASDGDWVIKGVAGEFYPCKPDIFEATYERVDG